jgi:undecaprenyl diphosphate synthase
MSDKIILPKDAVIPNHIAIILDGNRRWARAKGLPTLEGHRAGFAAGMKIAKASRDWGVHTFTVWGFSTENWDRSPTEISYLMKLYRKMLDEIRKEAKKDQIRFVHLGREDRFPKDLIKYFRELEEETKDYNKHVFNVALDYGGHDEIVRATQKIINDGVKSKDVDEKLFASYLDTGDQPYPYVDLFIRTSGEQRTSGFLPWQLNYAEFYWELGHLPDMTPEKLRDIIIDFSRRRRRFGGNDEVRHFGFDPEVLARLELKWWRLGKIPEGTKFREYALDHIKEQYGLSKSLAGAAAKLFVEAIAEENDNKLEEAKKKLKEFYELIRDEVKLAFEPEIVAALEIRMRGEKGEGEGTTQEYLAEVYRISLFQAAKAARLKALANVERNLAQSGKGEVHWERAEDYLQKYYQALKERVA